MEWIVACDQPFIEAETPQFKRMVQALNPKAVVPSADTIQRRVLDCTDDSVQELQTMIKVCILGLDVGLNANFLFRTSTVRSASHLTAGPLATNMRFLRL